MSLRVYNAHTGRSVDLVPEEYLSLPELKDAITLQQGVSSGQQILMTSRSTRLKMSNLVHETEIYLFDRSLLAQPNPNIPPSMSPLLPLNIQPVPNITTVKPTQEEMVELFHLRASWSCSLLTRAESLNSSLQTTLTEIKVIKSSVDVALAHLNQHLNNIEKSFKQILDGVVSITQEYSSVDWNQSLERLKNLTVIESLGGGSLAAWVDHEKVVSIQADMAFNSQNVQNRVRDINFVSDKIISESQTLHNDIDAWHETENKYIIALESSPAMLEDIQAVVRKINKDAEYVANLPNTPASIRSISRMASLHQREYLPNVSSAVSELWELNRNARSRKSTIQISSLRHLHTLSLVQSKASPIRPDIASVEREIEHIQTNLQILKQMNDLPLIYGSLLIECIRRSEWNDRIKSLTGEVAEEFALWKEDEQKRRMKWIKRFGESLDMFQHNYSGSALNSASAVSNTGISTIMSLNSIDSLRNPSNSVVGIELNLIGSKEDVIIAVTRDDVLGFVQSLATVPGTELIAMEIQKMLSELDIPSTTVSTSQDRRREKLFKNGSFTEHMRSSMFSRSAVHGSKLIEEQGSAEGRGMEENRRLQEKLKGYESRVRRLEDLLHRQYRSSSAGSGSLFPMQSPGGPLSRHQSFSAMNSSPPQYHDRTAVSPQQKSLSQSPYLTSGSNELMYSNRSASPRSDRFEGSSAYSASVVSDLKNEILQLRTALDKERDSNGRLRRQMAEQEHNLQEIEVIKQDLLANLSQQEAEFQRERKSLCEEISLLKMRVYALEEEEQTLEESRADKEGLIANLETALDEQQLRERDLEDVKLRLDAEIRDLREECRSRKEEILRMNDRLAEIKNDRERQELEILEIKRSAKEKARDEVAKELEDIENKTHELEEDRVKAVLESTIAKETIERQNKLIQAMWNGISETTIPEDEVTMEEFEHVLNKISENQTSLETEKQALVSENKRLRESLDSLTQLHDDRTLRARDLTQRLYTFYRRSRQLMDSLGMVYSGCKMVFTFPTMEEALYKVLPEKERSRYASSEAQIEQIADADVSNGSIPASIPDVDVLYWMESPKIIEDEEVDELSAEADRYMKYLDAITFDYDAFSEAVRDRVHDAETIARKWNKMARLYREKARRAKKESSEKIAYRSFKPGDLALFLPTSSKVDNANHVWAAFNDGAPYCFLREDEMRNLEGRQWMVGRISRMVEDADERLAKSVDTVKDALASNEMRGMEMSSYGANSAPTSERSNVDEISKSQQHLGQTGDDAVEDKRYVVDAVEVTGEMLNMSSSATVRLSEHRRPSALAAAAAKRTNRPELDGMRASSSLGSPIGLVGIKVSTITASEGPKGSAETHMGTVVGTGNVSSAAIDGDNSFDKSDPLASSAFREFADREDNITGNDAVAAATTVTNTGAAV
ncbi:hypothetical protein V1511DRAFT_511724 [Dipodascopsis uninucleata]